MVWVSIMLTIIVKHNTGNKARALHVPSQLVYIYISRLDWIGSHMGNILINWNWLDDSV
jgi:hypothetical protein